MMYGVWYDDGNMDFGWLSEEGRHGRDHRLEYDTLEEAEVMAKDMRTSHLWRDEKFRAIFSAEPIDGDARQRFKRIRALAKEHRIKLLEAEIASIRGREE
jgi:hypothetical protein